MKKQYVHIGSLVSQYHWERAHDRFGIVISIAHPMLYANRDKKYFCIYWLDTKSKLNYAEEVINNSMEVLT